MKYTIVAIIVICVIAAVCETAPTRCGPNEYKPSCEPCNITCTDDNKICTMDCVETYRCFCIPGYLKKNGVCVPRSQC
ncbi:unnamed protein product [Callosobruchus maculatus]|uniref:Uncharacterized protein n=1 Tax=Callosobruchus maculatus TaxID=64391 RepID=A0A653D379_CALMS|nr:unnamed protein product [Callosobruchus maculatus]